MKKFYESFKFGLLQIAKAKRCTVEELLRNPIHIERAIDAGIDMSIGELELANVEGASDLWKHRPVLIYHSRLRMAFEERILKGAGCHYFFKDEELFEWTECLSSQFRKGFLDYLLKDQDWICGVVYTPGKKPGAVLFGVHRDAEHGPVLLVAESDRSSAFGNLSMVWAENESPIQKAPLEVRKVIGLAYYAMQYEGAVTLGLPDFVKHPSHFKVKNACGVQIVDAIRNPNPHGPRFVPAGWRTLRHERFVHMRYQQVRVKQYHTGGGKAKTVNDVR